jgi:hypothetical protein
MVMDVGGEVQGQLLADRTLNWVGPVYDITLNGSGANVFVFNGALCLTIAPSPVPISFSLDMCYTSPDDPGHIMNFPDYLWIMHSSATEKGPLRHTFPVSRAVGFKRDDTATYQIGMCITVVTSGRGSGPRHAPDAGHPPDHLSRRRRCCNGDRFPVHMLGRPRYARQDEPVSACGVRACAMHAVGCLMRHVDASTHVHTNLTVLAYAARAN